MSGSENSTVIMFWYVYIIQSVGNKSLYVGYTQDLEKRLKEHNHGLNFSTKPYRPWRIVHFEAYRNEKDAKRRERYLKTSQGSRLLRRMLKEYFYENK
ncbi:MAG: putative endonuclease [Parcubacteria group bacterium Gr01-1014_3]|nr:MAG: putative endonuclease [Parcubacteria group bacterium Gr01-1014_3]